jgi:hypothetical protein
MSLYHNRYSFAHYFIYSWKPKPFELEESRVSGEPKREPPMVYLLCADTYLRIHSFE